MLYYLKLDFMGWFRRFSLPFWLLRAHGKMRSPFQVFGYN